MAVDTLAFVSRGVYDSAGTAQAVVNARFASWGMIGAGGEPVAETGPFHHPTMPSMASMPSMKHYFASIAVILGAILERS